MPRIGTASVNTPLYWDGVYGSGQYPTLDINNMARFRAAAAMQVGNTALDVGCGQAGLGKILVETYPALRYVGWDYSAEGLRTHVLPDAERHRWALRHGGVEDVAATGERYETVYLCEIVEHVDDPVALLDLMAPLAIRRLVVTVPQYGVLSWELHRGEHAWDFTPAELVGLLKPYGTLLKSVAAGSVCTAIAVDRGQACA